MDKQNPLFIKQNNRRRVLGLLQQKPLSRVELAGKLGLTRAAISLITEDLLSDGLICEAPATICAKGRGRTPTALQICPDTCYAVGISLGRWRIRIGIEDLCGKVICGKLLPNCSLSELIRALEAMLSEAGLPKNKLLGIGVSAPGPVDTEGGIILNPPDFPLWTQCPICRQLEEALGLPAYLENDANAAALFNRRYFDFPEKDDFLLLYLSVGVGSGVISRGQLLRECEFGHASINFSGPVCSCGNRGCLEAYASVSALLKQFPQYQTWEQLLDSPHRAQALTLEADYLAVAILNICNTLSIRAVLFDGLLQQCYADLLPLIEQRIRGKTLFGTPIRLLCAIHNAHSSVQSACSIVFSRFLDV